MPSGLSQHSPPNSKSPIVGWFLLLVLVGGLGFGGYALARSTTLQAKSQPESETGDAAETKEESENPKEEPKKNADEGKPEFNQPDFENPFPNRFPAPSLEGGTAWLNTSGEINLKDLRGKVVLLDFWTYCCINCLHVLPDLKYLEKKYNKELVVIGVHSAKFDNEKDAENIRQAIMRYEIEHPVINDSQMTVWRKFGARAWPTIVLIDPEGNYCGYLSGEGNREILDEILGKVIEYHKKKKTLDETPIQFGLEKFKAKPTPLRYPGKVLADEKNDRLFISDCNHNRIVVTSLDGTLKEIIGSGAIGAKDGSYSEASFDHLQGMELVGEKLYVADTENHLIRVVDLDKKSVSTLAGTGKQDQRRTFGGKLQETDLNSPWALIHHEGVLYIAMAGPHQLWSHKLGSDEIGVYAGSGREDIWDGRLADAAFAQPSGFATDGKYFYVADSEGSSIRKVPFGGKGEVSTVIGAANMLGGRALFEFGDTDGVGTKARLQHPLGLAHLDGTLYVADTYNHKIKKINLKQRRVTSWLGDGDSGTRLDPPRFAEPSGLTIAKNKLYVADTNNHRICVVDLKTEQVTELNIAGLTPPKKQTGTSETASSKDATELKLQKLAPGEKLKVQVKVKLPEDHKLNKLAPVAYVISSQGEQTLIAADHLNKRKPAGSKEDTILLSIPLTKAEGQARFTLSVAYTYCRGGDSGVCKLKQERWTIPIEIAAGNEAESVELSSDVTKSQK